MKRPTSKTKGKKWEDHYSRRAKKEHFPARSVYKLQEIQHKYHLIKKGNKVLDMGCFPGSWLLYAAELTGDKGKVIGIDKKPVSIKLPSYVEIYSLDILSMDEESLQAMGKNFNVILSDMAPATTGKKNVDAVRSFQLCQAALNIAKNLLVTGGAFVCKIFQGEEFKSFTYLVKENFKSCKIYKPQSSRKASMEIYVIGIGKKTGGNHVRT